MLVVMAIAWIPGMFLIPISPKYGWIPMVALFYSIGMTAFLALYKYSFEQEKLSMAGLKKSFLRLFKSNKLKLLHLIFMILFFHVGFLIVVFGIYMEQFGGQ